LGFLLFIVSIPRREGWVGEEFTELGPKQKRALGREELD